MKFILGLILFLTGVNFIMKGAFDPYYESLRLHVKRFESFAAPGIDTFFVKKQSFHPDYYGVMSNAFVKTIDNELLYQKTKDRQNLLLVVISPIKVAEGKQIILVTNYDVRRKGNKYSYAGADVTKCQLDFNCESNSFELWRDSL